MDRISSWDSLNMVVLIRQRRFPLQRRLIFVTCGSCWFVSSRKPGSARNRSPHSTSLHCFSSSKLAGIPKILQKHQKRSQRKQSGNLNSSVVWMGLETEKSFSGRCIKLYSLRTACNQGSNLRKSF